MSAMTRSKQELATATRLTANARIEALEAALREIYRSLRDTIYPAMQVTARAALSGAGEMSYIGNGS